MRCQGERSNTKIINEKRQIKGKSCCTWRENIEKLIEEREKKMITEWTEKYNFLQIFEFDLSFLVIFFIA